jgi:predicted transcriptional regulator
LKRDTAGIFCVAYLTLSGAFFAPSARKSAPPDAHCFVSIGCKLAQTMDVFLGLIEDGVTECGQIAQEMKTSPATISRLAKRAIDAGKIIKKSREYFLAEGQKADKKP